MGVTVNVVLLKVSSAKGEGDVTWVFPGGFGRGGWFSQGGFRVLGVLLLKIRKGRVWRSRYRLVCFWRESLSGSAYHVIRTWCESFAGRVGFETVGWQ